MTIFLQQNLGTAWGVGEAAPAADDTAIIYHKMRHWHIIWLFHFIHGLGLS